MMTPLRILSGLMIAALVAVADQAPAYAVDIIAPSGQSLTLEVNKGRLVRLDQAAATVFVADPDTADVQVKSTSLVYLTGKKAGETTLFAVGAGEKILASIDVKVTHNLPALRAAVDDLHPGADIQVSNAGGRIVLDGVVGDPAVAENVRQLALGFASAPTDVINRIGIDAPSQVNLRVRVAEISRDVDKQLGFNWSLVGKLAGFSFGLTTSNPFSSSVTAHTLSASGNLLPNWDFNTVIDALEQEGMVSVLAEPNLTALSGETASFLAGGEFPILVPGGDNGTTIEFKKFGVSLEFTPTIAGNGRINLHVRPEVSQLSSTNAVTLDSYSIPSLTTRRAETTIELGSGQSFAIAGLIQNNVTHDISKFPGLGDVPVLGQLFRSDRFQRDESELVIIVTPYLVRPVRTAKLASPTDGFQPPSDPERIMTGGFYKRAPKAGRPRTVDEQGRTLIGPAGFELN